jgi:serine/threonine protein kinase
MMMMWWCMITVLLQIVSPEMVEGKEISFAADIWSFGCTIYEIVTGLPPWGKLEPMAALFRIHTSDSLPPLTSNSETEFSDLLKDFISYEHF